MQKIYKYLTKEVADNYTQSTNAHKKETLDKGNLGDEETLKQKALKEKLKEQTSQLKSLF